jgi:hypothetical protein
MKFDFPIGVLAAPLAAEQRGLLRGTLSALLDWQRTLSSWPILGEAPDATPIVSLYRRGCLAGCAGMSEGAPGERLARAFLAAFGDLRFGGLDATGRAELVAQVSYAHSPQRVSPDQAASLLAVGVHGLAVRTSEGNPYLLLPDVARDHHFGPEQFLEALAHKAGTPQPDWPRDGLWLFETERVIARPLEQAESELDARLLAVRWLTRRVQRTGAIGFGLDPRDGSEAALGPMMHGRSAITVRALDSHPEGRAAAARARRWLTREIADALAGLPVPGWPEERAMIAGTLALAALAGIDVEAPLVEFASDPELLHVPWHAAQVVAALGARAPERLWQGCVSDLERNAWAPWTAIAAHRRGSTEVFERAIAGLSRGVRGDGPHTGGVGPGAVPELARTAASVEALTLAGDAEALAAVRRARAFLRRHQLRAESYPLSSELDWADGAFPVSPVRDYLQTDVTAHAALALAEN